MNDLISRQAAVDALNEYFVRIGKLKRRGLTQGEKAISLDTVGAIKTLPSAEPKKGKWIIRDNPGTGWYRITCSECGEDVTSNAPCIGFFPNAKVLWNYCPNCGYRMDEE